MSRRSSAPTARPTARCAASPPRQPLIVAFGSKCADARQCGRVGAKPRPARQLLRRRRSPSSALAIFTSGGGFYRETLGVHGDSGFAFNTGGGGEGVATIPLRLRGLPGVQAGKRGPTLTRAPGMRRHQSEVLRARSRLAIEARHHGGLGGLGGQDLKRLNLCVPVSSVVARLISLGLAERRRQREVDEVLPCMRLGMPCKGLRFGETPPQSRTV